MFRILVTNDDGIKSPGIERLVKELSKIAEVYVVAPTEQQSAKGMSLTVRRNVTAQRVELEGAKLAYAIDGTPADCVKWGLMKFDEVDFDYVFSGINTGYNLSSAVYYSGTVGAAREGALNGYKSIALSVEDHSTREFDYISSIIPEMIKLDDIIGSDAVLSVNAPNLPADKVKGYKIVPAAAHDYGDCYTFFEDGDEYSMNVYFSELDKNLENDFNLIADAYATVTPISIAITDNDALAKLLKNQK